MILLLMLFAADLPKGAIARAPDQRPWWHAPQLSPDGKRLAVASKVGVRVIDLDTADDRAVIDPVRTKTHDNNRPFTFAFSPDGKELFVANHTPRLAVYDPATAKHLRDITIPPRPSPFEGHAPTPVPVYGVYPAYDGRFTLLHTGNGLERLLARDRRETLRKYVDWVTQVSRDGRFVGSVDTQASIEGAVNVTDLKGDAGFYAYPDDHFAVSDVAPSEDGKRIAASVWLRDDCRVLRVWNADGKRVELARAEGAGGPLGFTPDGKMLIAQAKGRLQRWDMTTGKRLTDVELPTDGRVVLDRARTTAYVIGGGYAYRVALTGEE